ncbi:MAG: hypothetical protein K9M81_03050 [Chthoniobacterales bacterium]|nr:hypothetical protein [Chthoniobacterales bacterium]
MPRRLYVSYCPRSNSKLTQYPSGVRKPQQNQYEISGLNSRFITNTIHYFKKFQFLHESTGSK